MRIESLARALQGDLTYSPGEVKALDRLTAMALGSIDPRSRTAQEGARWAQANGRADPTRSARESLLCSLGVSLIAFKHAGRDDMGKRAVGDLRDCLLWRMRNIGRKQREKIAAAAITEWIEDQCETCRGARMVFDYIGVERPCLVCNGSGKRLYTDGDRDRRLGEGQGVKHIRHMEIAHAMIGFGVSFAVRQAAERMR